MLEDDFVAFHLASAGKGSRKSLARTKSVVLKGTGEQAAMAFGFSKFERVVTTLIATLLDRGSIISLLGQIEEKVSKDASSGDLGVIKVADLKDILNGMGKSDCVTAIEKQNKAKVYESYPYEFAVLKPFTKKPEGVHLTGDSRASKMGASTVAISMRNLNKSIGASSQFRGGNRRSQMSKTMSGI